MKRWEQISYLAGVLLTLITVVTPHSYPLTKQEVFLRTPHVRQNHQGLCVFTDTLTLDVLQPSTDREWNINLKRDDVIPMDRSVYLMTNSGLNDLKEFQVTTGEHTGVQAYHNHSYGAAFTIKCAHTGNHKAVFLLEGSMFIGQQKYRITPVPTWRQHMVTFPNHVTCVYEIEKIDDFPAAHLAARFPRHNDHASTQTGREPTRHKREVTLPVTYYIDILTVVDNTLYARFLDQNKGDLNKTISSITDYLASLFTAVSMRLDTLSLEGRSLKIRLLKPLILFAQDKLPYNRSDLLLQDGVYKINATVLLFNFKNWLTQNTNLGLYDHAMFITALDIFGGGDNGIKFNVTKGQAFVGSICRDNGESSSVIEDKGAYQSEGVVSHEIAHNLGARHDGDNNACYSPDRYIMSDGNYPEYNTNSLNPWKFSACSSSDILNLLKTLEKDTTLLQRCLISTSGSNQSEYTTISADDQCKLFYGNTSFICRGQDMPSLATVCDEFYCRVPGTEKCERMIAATGTCCGYQKKCYLGQCIEADQGECPINEICPFGDQPGIIVLGKTCAQLEAAYCYTENINLKCCETCQRKWVDRQGCHYGDKQLGCNSTDCGSHLGQLPYDFICCGTCHGGCQDEDVLTISGVTYTCKDYILTLGNKYVCYTESILKTSCCRSCEDARDTTRTSCPWGDIKNCTSLLKRPAGYVCSDADFQNCCYTCDLLKSASTTTKVATTTTKPATTTKAATTTKEATTTTKPTTTTKAATTTKVTTTTTKPTTTKAATTTKEATTTETSPTTTKTMASSVGMQVTTSSSTAPDMKTIRLSSSYMLTALVTAYILLTGNNI